MTQNNVVSQSELFNSVLEVGNFFSRWASFKVKPFAGCTCYLQVLKTDSN